MKKSVEEMPSTNKSLVSYILYAGLTVSLVGCVWFGYSYYKAQKQISYLSTAQAQQEIAKKEVQDLVNNVAKHMVLPQEEPTITTIDNIDSLKKDQPFYEGAKNGDKILAFSQKVVIYDPIQDVLVNVGPVYRAPEPPVPAPVEVSGPLTLEIRNGSKIVGLAQELSAKFGAKADVYKVASVNKAKDREYQGIILVNITGRDVSALESELKVTATAMPEGEVASTADALIILGN